MMSAALLSTGCATSAFREGVIRGDKAGRTFDQHSDWMRTTYGVYLGTTTLPDGPYHRFGIVDIFWTEGGDMIELLVPAGTQAVARISRNCRPMSPGKVVYITARNTTPWRMSPAEIMISEGKLASPSPTNDYDSGKQLLFPNDYPALVSVKLTEHGKGSCVTIGRQLRPEEKPTVTKSPHWGHWEYPDKYQWVGTEAVRRHLDQCVWWTEWSDTYPIEGDVLPTSLKVRRAVLSPGYVVTVAWDIVAARDWPVQQ